MASIEVDVELSEFSSSDIIEEIIDRLDAKCWRKFTDSDKNKIRAAFRISDAVYLPQKTIEDISKAEVIRQYWDKFNSIQLEERLK